MDILPENAVFGSPAHHVIADILKPDGLFNGQFDAILLNGVFGYGVDDLAAMEIALLSIHRLLHAGGALLIGWNRGLVPDPLTLGNCRRYFRHTSLFGLPQRISFNSYKSVFSRKNRLVDLHCFDWFKAIESSAHP